MYTLVTTLIYFVTIKEVNWNGFLLRQIVVFADLYKYEYSDFDTFQSRKVNFTIKECKN